VAQTSNEVTYAIDKEIIVPPFSKVQVISCANWIENLSIPYKAKITVTGIAPHFVQDSRLDSHTIKVLLNKYGFNERLLRETLNYITFETRGTFRGSFGLDSVFSSTLIRKTRNNNNYYYVTASQSLTENGEYIKAY
jgi:hypothetical protein